MSTRRDFITLLGGAATALPLAARAQQPALPIVGFVSGRSTDTSVREVAAFQKGFNETGYVEGQNATIEYHWLEGQYDRLPSLIADLARRGVAACRACGQSCDHNNTDRLLCRRRPRQAWSGRQRCPTGR